MPLEPATIMRFLGDTARMYHDPRLCPDVTDFDTRALEGRIAAPVSFFDAWRYDPSPEMHKKRVATIATIPETVELIRQTDKDSYNANQTALIRISDAAESIVERERLAA